MGVPRRIGVLQDVGDDDERTGLDRGFDGIGIRHRDDRIGRHDPERLDAAVGDGPEHVDGLQAGLARQSSGDCQKRWTRSRSSAFSIAIWAASMLASPPTSRPPMAFGWPVSENGPMPGRPMRPVARWQLMMALTLSVPEDGLVDALAVAGDDLLRRLEQAEELAQLHGGQAGLLQQIVEAERRGCGESLGEAVRCVRR